MVKATIPQKTQHRRRTEDELNKALAVIEAKRAHLLINADDEHDVVLADAVTELLATRHIIAKLMSELGKTHQEATVSLKNLFL